MNLYKQNLKLGRKSLLDYSPRSMSTSKTKINVKINLLSLYTQRGMPNCDYQYNLLFIVACRNPSQCMFIRYINSENTF